MNAAIYISKSREDKTKPAHRLTVQREQLPAYAKQQGWAAYIYDDSDASAARGKSEDLQQRSCLEADIQTGKINIILTIEFPRRFHARLHRLAAPVQPIPGQTRHHEPHLGPGPT